MCGGGVNVSICVLSASFDFPQIFVLLYLVSVTFIIVNMFVSILNDTFSEVRSDVNKNINEYEILQFMMGRFMNWTGIQEAPKGNAQEGRPLKGVERFLQDGSLLNCPAPAQRILSVDVLFSSRAVSTAIRGKCVLDVS